MQLVIRETEYRTFSSFCMNIDNNLMNIFWVVLQKPRPPFRWRMVTACWPEAYRPQTGWNQRLKFQKYHPVTSPPTNQKGREMIIYPETFSPNIVLKNPCLKAIQGVQTIWARAACSPCLVLVINLSWLQTPVLQFDLTVYQGHVNLGSITH